VINYSADSEDNLKLVSNTSSKLDLIKIKNPMSKDVEFMKSTLKSGILKSLSFNLKNSIGNLMLFELGTVFSKNGPNKLPSQSKYLCCGIAGDIEKSIWEEERSIDIYDAKSLLEGFFKELSIDFSIIPSSSNIFTEGYGYKILIDELEVGDFGEISKKVSSRFGIKNRSVILIDLDLEKLFKRYIPKSEIKYTKISKYPVSIRDISLIINEEVFSEKIISIIQKFDLVRSCEAIDIYQGDPMEKNKKSLTIRITYGSEEKTLSGTEVDTCESNILKSLENNLEFSLRK
jgi:phenylalanyl-tRNA synthetase beta chain